MKKKYIADIILIIGLLVLTVILSFFIYKKDTSDDLYVEISIDGKLIDRFELDKNMENVLSTGNKLIINNGCVYIKDADCPDRLCVKQGTISKANESIICLPNRLVVRIVESKGASNQEEDTGMDVIQ